MVENKRISDNWPSGVLSWEQLARAGSNWPELGAIGQSWEQLASSRIISQTIGCKPETRDFWIFCLQSWPIAPRTLPDVGSVSWEQLASSEDTLDTKPETFCQEFPV